MKLVALDEFKPGIPQRTGKQLPVDGKAFRYTQQRIAQSVLYEQNVDVQHRTVWCSRTFKNDEALIYRTLDGSNARLAGVHLCGNPWTCPICSAGITEERKTELIHALNRHVTINKGWVYLLTLTFPHHADQPLAELVTRQADALARLKNSRVYKSILGENKKKPGSAGRIGSVKSLEITYGDNGWHPHTHDLVFAKINAFDEKKDPGTGKLSSPAIDELRGAWIKACFKAGLATIEQLQDMIEHSFDIRGGQFAAEYIAKYGHESGRWGMADELTKSHCKSGMRGGHYTPFQLLTLADAGEARAAVLFREFAAAFKGKRMLTWTPKLRKSLAMDDEVTDQALVDNDNAKPAEELAGVITIEQFKIILSRNSLGEFLKYVAGMCCIPATAQSDIDDFIRDLVRKRKKYSGIMRQHNAFGPGYSVLDGACV